ncbi:MAG: DUF3127 domain-containing protein [Bacteroidia bacterium]
MEVTGQLKVKFDTQRISDKFQKREFVLSTELSTPYPQHVSFQLTQDKCALLDSYNVGDELKVQFNLRGREWNGPQGIKYFNTLEAWRIEKVSAGAVSQGNTQQSSSSGQSNNSGPVFTSSVGDNDDLPF